MMPYLIWHLLFQKTDLLLFNCSQSICFDSFFYNYPFNDYEYFSGSKKKEIYSLLCSGSTLNNLATKCIKKSLFDSIYSQPIDHFCNAEDFYVSLQLINCADTISFYNEPLYYYRINNSSSTHTFNEGYFRLCVEYAEKWDSDLLKLAKKRASKSIIHSIEYVLHSDLSLERCKNEIIDIVSSEFFKKYIMYFPSNLSKKQLLLYLLALTPRLISNETVLIILKKWC